MPRTEFLRGFTTNIVCTGLTFGLGAANQALLARGLGTEGRGQLGLVVTTVMFASLFLGEFLSRGNTYVTGKEQNSRAVAANTVIYCFLTMVILLVAALIISHTWERSGNAFLKFPQCYFVAVIIILMVFHRSLQAILLGQERLLFYALVPVVFIVIYLTGNAYVMTLGDIVLGDVLISWVVAGIAVTCMTFIPYVGCLFGDGGPSRCVDMSLFHRTVGVGLRGAVSVTIIFLMFRCDVYIVGHFLGDGALGVYMIAVVIAEMMQRLPNVAGVVLLPKIIAGRDRDDTLTLLVARNVFGFSLVAAVAIWLGGGMLIDLVFGENYAAAYTPLVWMLPGLVASGYGSVLNTRLAGQGYPAITVWAPTAALLIKIIAAVVLIPVLGLNGAAISTSIAYALWAAIITIHYVRITSVTLRDFSHG